MLPQLNHDTLWANFPRYWTFTFTGSGKSKYSNELLGFACNFNFEYNPELKRVILDNWLCNLEGHAGHWSPLDLLQKKMIRQLKSMAARRDHRFDGAFYQDVVSLNMRAFVT